MEKLILKNFRVFETQTSFDLPLITILTGKNNAGKSTINKAILLLNDFVNNENQLQLSFEGKYADKHKINVFENAKTWNSKSQNISFSFLHNGLESSYEFKGRNEDEFASLVSYSAKIIEINDTLELKRNSENHLELKVSQLFIDHLSKNPRREKSPESLSLFSLASELKELKGIRNTLVHDEDKVKKGSKEYVAIRSELQKINKRIELVEERLDKESAFDNKRKHFFNSLIQLGEEENRSLINIIRKGLFNYFNEESKDKKGTLRFSSTNETNMTLFRLSDQLQRKINFSVFHLSPNRFKQERLYIKNDESEINKALSDFASHKPRKGSLPDIFLKKWLKEFEIGEDIEVKNVEGSASTIYIIRKDKNKPVNLVDMGFGAGQILTILLKITNILNDQVNLRFNRRYRFDPIILVEEPETNLHPSVQSKLADLFFEAGKEHGIQFILETHSEYLIRKFQVIVKENNDNSFIKVYYFDKDGPYDMELAENGKFQKEFGKGFTDEAARQVLNLL
jgi:predicted ATPase